MKLPISFLINFLVAIFENWLGQVKIPLSSKYVLIILFIGFCDISFSLLLTNQKEIIHAGDTYLYDATLDADNTNKAIAIKVNGDNSETMRWSALVKLTEVTHT